MDEFRVLPTGNESCSATWVHADGPGHGRGTCEASSLGGPDQWYVNRALVQGQGNVRGLGIGSRLLSAVKTKAKEMGATRLLVTPGGYGEDPDKQAHFYEKNGFVCTDERGLWECKL